MWVTARAVCGRVLSPPVWSPRFPGSLPYVEQPQSTDTSQTRHPVLPCTPDSCQYQMDIVRTRGCNLQMIRDLFNRITYGNCWTLNNWTNTSRPWPGLLVTQTGGWWYVTTDYVRSHHNIHVLRGCSGLLGWCGLVWAGVGVLPPLLQNHKLNFLNWGGETLPPSWAAACRAGQKTIHIWDWNV